MLTVTVKTSFKYISTGSADAMAPMAKAGGAFMTISSPVADQVTGVASLCALGKTSGDPLKSMFRYFKPEYEARIAAGSGDTK